MGKVWHPLLAFELILAIKIYFPDLFDGSEHSLAIPTIHPTRLIYTSATQKLILVVPHINKT